MRTYKLENLSCAHCAASIEQALEGLECVQSARLQFATLDLHLDTTDLDQVKKTIESIEPGVRLLEGKDPLPQANSHLEWTRWLILAGGSLALTALLVAQALGWKAQLLADLAYGVLYVGLGWSVLRTATLNLVRGRVFDENFLMSVATLAAWVVGAGAEAASVMIFYQWGEALQEHAVGRSRRSLGALLASRPRLVRVVEAGQETHELVPEEVPAGTVFEVRAGEQIPLDGVVLSGVGSVDTSALTGESLPRTVEAGVEVSAGFLNGDGVLRLRSLRPFSESVWAGVVSSVDQALAKKAPLDRFITRFARSYTPAVLALALLLFLSLTLVGLAWQESLYRSLVLLVISCPCALMVSVPLTYLGAIGAASKKGLLIRDAGALDRLAKVNAAAFDKTGTLTKGKLQVKQVLPSGPPESLRAFLSAGFSASSHPLSKAWGTVGTAPEKASEFPGQGVVFTLGGVRAAIGSRQFLAQQDFPGIPAEEDSTTTVHAANEHGYLGRVEFEDAAKPDASSALAELKSLGIHPLAMLSGDSPREVERWGSLWGLEARGGLLPDDKSAFVQEWTRQGKQVVFVGDGLNDAPVLACASVGVSLGAGASAAAMETADVAILDTSVRQVGRLVRLGRRTRVILYQNIGLALGLKAVFLVLGGMGLAGLWEAVFADVGVALLAVANSLRAAKPLR